MAYSEERGGYYLLMGYHDVKAAHSNWQQFSTEPSIMRPLSEKPPLPPLEYHPPVHTAWRRLFTEAFNNKTPDPIEADVRADIAARIDEFAAAGRLRTRLRVHPTDPAQRALHDHRHRPEQRQG